MKLPGKTLSLMAAMSENYVIGKAGDLPWHLPKDFKRFKKKTEGHDIIMGRKTYESLGGKPLPKRKNIVITRKAHYASEDVTVVRSFEEALEEVKQSNDDEPFVIGGGEIYKLALPYADRIYLTIVHTTLNGDTFFPEFDEKKWEITEKEPMPADEKHNFAFTFLTYDRKH